MTKLCLPPVKTFYTTFTVLICNFFKPCEFLRGTYFCLCLLSTGKQHYQLRTEKKAATPSGVTALQSCSYFIVAQLLMQFYAPIDFFASLVITTLKTIISPSLHHLDATLHGLVAFIGTVVSITGFMVQAEFCHSLVEASIVT